MYKLPASITRNHIIELSPKSKLFIGRIFKIIDEQKEKLKMSDFVYLEEHEKGVHYSLLETDVQHAISILNTISKHLKYTFTISHRTFNVYLTYPEDFPEKEIVESMENIYSWLYIASHFSEQRICSQTLDIYIYWTGLIKKLPKNHTVR
jgi:hypothetical protein